MTAWADTVRNLSYSKMGFSSFGALRSSHSAVAHPVSNQGAYLAIGVSKDDVYNWTVRSSTNPERCEFIKKVQKICAFYRESLMASGKLNPVVGIFWQKNYDGFKDQQEVVLTPNTDPLGEQKDPESMRQKYLEATYNLAESAESAERAISDPLQLPERTREEAPAQNP